MERLSRVNILGCFDHIVCGDEVVHRKPDPEIYNTVLFQCHASKETALVFEDSVFGVEAAYRAGIPCIMCPSIVPPSKKQEEETIAIVQKLSDVIPMLKH